MVQNIEVDKGQIADFWRRHRIRRLSLFGSVLRDDFRTNSDVDFLVLFEPGYPVGFRIFDMEEELTRLFHGHRADIVNHKYLNHRLRDRILSEAEVQYEEG